MNTQQPTNQEIFDTMMRGRDHRVNELIKILHQKNILEETEFEQLLKLRPFPQLAV